MFQFMSCDSGIDQVISQINRSSRASAARRRGATKLTRAQLLQARCELMESRLLLSGELPPTATFAAAAVSEGQVATVVFSDVADPTPGASGTTFLYSYDFNNDGTFDVVDSSQPTAPVPANLTLEGPATLTVAGRVTASTGTFSNFSTALTVNNAPPTYNGSLAGTVTEGGVLNLTFDNNYSDSPEDLHALISFTLISPTSVFRSTQSSWNSSGGVVTVSAFVKFTSSAFGDGPLATSATIRMTDRDGGFTDVVIPVTVLDSAPILSGRAVTGNNTVNEGVPFTLGLSAADLGLDTISSWDINWGDGSAVQTVAGTTTSLPHTYADSGRYNIAITATNEDGSFTRTGLVSAYLDSSYASNGTLATPGTTNGLTRTQAVGPDGSFYSINPATTNSQIEIYKYLPNGSLDLSWGSNGVVTTPEVIGMAFSTIDGRMASVDSQGRLVFAFQSYDNNTIKGAMSIYRLTATGQLDATFGSGGVVRIYGSQLPAIIPPSPTVGTPALVPKVLRVMPDDSVAVLALYETAYVVWLNTDGTLRSGFNSSGKPGVSRLTAGSFVGAITQNNTMSLEPGPDGGIWLVNIETSVSSPVPMGMSLIKSNGRVDSTRGNFGFIRHPALSAAVTFLNSNRPISFLQSDGKVIIAAGAMGGGTDGSLIIARFNADGTPDTNFGTNGTTLIRSLTRSRSITQAVFTQDSQGRILIGFVAQASAPNGFPNVAASYAVARMLTDGTLDSSFGSQGISATAQATVNNFIYGSTLSIRELSDGRIILGNSGQVLAFLPSDGKLAVNNVAPTATLTGPSTIAENQAATFTFSNPVDIAADLSAGLRYSLDFTNDGVFDITDSLDPNLTIPAGVFAGPNTLTVRARVSDKDGGFTDTLCTLAITNVEPSAGSLIVTPAALIAGGQVTLTLDGLSDPANALSSVSFYQDSNNDGLLDPALDLLLATVPVAGNATAASTTVSSPAVSGSVRYLARVGDAGGLFSAVRSATVTLLPVTIGSLSSSLPLVNRGSSFTLTANNIQLAPGAKLTKVEFYRDLNGNGIIDTSTDRYHGVDTSSSAGWSFAIATSASWPIGPQTFLARAFDSVTGSWSNTVTTVVTINSLPTVNALTASPAAAAPGAPITLAAANVSDVDGTINAVEIYFDANNNAKIDPSTDTKLTVTLDTSGSTPQYLASTTAPLIPGTYRYLARAQDDRGGWGALRSLTFYVSLAPRIEGDFTAAPNPVSKGQTINMTADNVVDDDGTVSSVSFYRDVDGDGQVGLLDKLLGTDSTAGDGFTLALTSTSTSLITGVNNLLAVARDNRGVTSLPKLTSVLIDTPPTLSSFATSSAPKASKPITLVAKGSSDITFVNFYRDDGDGLFNTSSDTLLGSGTFDSASNSWRLILPANTLPAGSVRLWASAGDGVGLSVPRKLVTSLGV